MSRQNVLEREKKEGRAAFELKHIKVLAVVMAQVVGRWHSVWLGRVQILGWTWAFFSLELLSIYSHWVSDFFNNKQ